MSCVLLKKGLLHIYNERQTGAEDLGRRKHLEDLLQLISRARKHVVTTALIPSSAESLEPKQRSPIRL